MKYIIFLLTFFTRSSVFSQPVKSTIAGTVIEKNSKLPLQFVTVLMLDGNDSSTITGTVTDKKGRFSISSVLPGNYIVHYSYIGYSNSQTKHLTITPGQKSINLGISELSNEANNLKEVVVTSKKSMLNTSIDRKIYNADQDIMSKSGSAADILKNIPSVEVDIDGQVSLRGSPEVMILINGKPSPLMGKSRAEVLQSLPANAIERIEVITNPSARYRPDGTSGIINIVLKKNIKRGWNGITNMNAGNKDRYNGTFTLNYNPGKINIFGTFSLKQENRTRINKIHRTYFDLGGNDSSYYNELNISKNQPVTKMANMGLDYIISKQQSAGISVGYYYRTQVKHDEVNKYTYNRQSILKNYYTRFRYDPEFEKQVNAKAYFEHKFAKEDHDIRMEFNTSRSDEAEDNHYRNVYQLPVLPASYDNTLIKPADTENQLTIDYTYPVSESAKLEAGYDGSFNKNDFNFYGEWYDTIQKHFIKDLQKSNEFIYKEMIHAIYFTWQKSMGAFGYEAGLRGEQVNIKGTLVTLDSLIKNNYIKIYPTLHLSYKINTLNEIQLNYSRRVNRPDPEQLNPFPEYRDPRNLQAGNAKLLPETINSVEFGYKWQKKNISFVPGIYYRNKTNGFTQVIKKLNDSTLLTTAANLANDRSAGLELIFSVKSGKLFNANMSSNIFYNQIDASNIGYTQTKSIISFNSTINATCNFAENTMFQASSNYRSARLTPQGKIAPSIVVNAGFRQDLYKKKITLTLTVSDIFASLKEKRDLNTLYLKQTTTGTRDARIFYLGVSYRFGKTIKVPKEEKLQFDNGG